MQIEESKIRLLIWASKRASVRLRIEPGNGRYSLGASEQEKGPRALILKGFSIIPGLPGTLLDCADGGEEEDRKGPAGRATPQFGQFGHGLVL